MKNIYIGTSGYQYRWWFKYYYPKGIYINKYLDYYSQDFNTVEINSTFYAMPKEKYIEKWYNTVPKNFKFTVKMNRIVTHYKKLKNVKLEITEFINSIKKLKNKLGCILFQFSDKFICDEKNKKRLIQLTKYKIIKNKKCSFEFRHSSWYNEKISKLLCKNGWNYSYSFYSENWNELKNVIKNTFNPQLNNTLSYKFYYLRLHGSKGQYIGNHGDKLLNQIKEFVKNNKVTFYIYFNNTDDVSYGLPSAIYDAKRLQTLIEN